MDIPILQLYTKHTTVTYIQGENNNMGESSKFPKSWT